MIKKNWFWYRTSHLWCRNCSIKSQTFVIYIQLPLTISLINFIMRANLVLRLPPFLLSRIRNHTCLRLLSLSYNFRFTYYDHTTLSPRIRKRHVSRKVLSLAQNYPVLQHNPKQAKYHRSSNLMKQNVTQPSSSSSVFQTYAMTLASPNPWRYILSSFKDAFFPAYMWWKNSQL